MLNKRLIKKGMSILLGGVMLTTLSPYAFAALPGSNDECYDALDSHRVFVDERSGLTFEIVDTKNRTAKIISADPGIGNIVELSTIFLDRGTYTVVAVGDGAFKNCKNLRFVILPEVTEIGNEAFAGCTALKRLDVQNCTIIGERAFAGCTALENPCLYSCTRIGKRAFLGCTALKIYCFVNCKYIDDEAFLGCTALEELYVPNCISIGERAFVGCGGLQTLEIHLGCLIIDVIPHNVNIIYRNI